jgi:hypothetical protein
MSWSPPPPLFFSPALPSELFTLVLEKCASPATLLICSTPEDFNDALKMETIAWREEKAAALYETMRRLDTDQDVELPTAEPRPPWLRSQCSMSTIGGNNVRVVFTPSVGHLRAWLAVFPRTGPGDESPEDKAGPAELTNVLFVYNFLGIHRDTDEWTAQGLGNTASALIEGATRNRLQPIIVEPSMYVEEGYVDLGVMIDQEVPILSLKNMKALAWGLEEEDDGSWITETTPVRKVLGRWFQFGPGPWDEEDSEEEDWEDEEPDDEEPEEGLPDEMARNVMPWTEMSQDDTPWETESEEDEPVMEYNSPP